MAKPPSPVYCPQLSAAALVAFDFAVWRCCFACFVAVVLVVFLYVFSRRIFFPLLLLLLLFWLQHTQQLFVHTFAWQNNFAGPQIRNLQPVEGVAPIPLSLAAAAPHALRFLLHNYYVAVASPTAWPAPFHTPHWVRVDFVVDVVGKAFTLFVVMPGQKPLARLKAEITLVWAAFKSLHSEFI